MNDLAEHFARVDWAVEEIKRLEAEVEKYAQSGPLEVYWHYDLHPVETWRLYRMRLTTPIPTQMQIHCGTILNDMRATLDALACTLATRNGHPNETHTYFPTGKTKDIFESKNTQDKIKKLSEQDKQVIAELKPYAGGNDMLYALHSSDIIRKHQRLIVLGGGVAKTTIGPDDGEWFLIGEKIDYMNLGPENPLDQPFARLAHDYHIEMRQTALIAFAEPIAIKAKPVVATLNDFAGLVRSILELFQIKITG
jgi:hypothetical protein